MLRTRYEPLFWRDMALHNQSNKRKAEQSLAETPSVREIIKEREVIVRVRCQYCKKLYEEILDKCPNCGGS